MSPRQPAPRDFPRGRQTVRMRLPSGQLVDLTLNWDYMRSLAERAATLNKTGRATMGPVAAKAVR